MKKHLIGILAVILLTGCASSPWQVRADLDQKRAVEDAAWERVAPMVKTQCGPGDKAPTRKKSVDKANCKADLVKENVLPYAAFPDLVLAILDQELQTSERFAKGKISAKEYMRQGKERSERYEAAWVFIANQQLAHAAQQEAQGDIWAQAFSQGLSNYQANQDRNNAIYQQTQDRYQQHVTNCYSSGYGNSVTTSCRGN